MTYLVSTLLWCALAAFDSAWGAGGRSSGATTIGEVAIAFSIMYVGHVVFARRREGT